MAVSRSNKQIEQFILAWDGQKVGKFFGALAAFAMIVLSRWPFTDAPRADVPNALLRLGWAFLGAYVVVRLTVYWSRRIILTDFVTQRTISGSDEEVEESDSREPAVATEPAEPPAPSAELPA